ncbi:MAG: MATE family efflux transporter [Woeseiaceae bacterium]
MTEEEPRLTEGPVGKHLLNMALPMLLGITTMMGQAFIDAYFLGMVGDRALAAHAFSFPVLMIVTSVAIGLGAGTSSVVARAIGARDMRRARRLATDSLMLSFLITAAFCVVGVLTIEPLFHLLGAPADMIPLIRGFMLILYSGVPFVVVGMVGMASMRATGDTRLPSTLMILGAILNVILDPVFIFGVGPIPGMGLNGAAIAALIARGIIFLGAIYLLRGRLNMISFNKPDKDELRKSWRDILHVGIPAAGTNAIVPIATAIITAMIAGYGPEAVAGFGVASRIESLVLVMFYALSGIIGPFVGQNLSVCKEGRILESMRLSMLFCLGSGLLIAVILAATSSALPSLFSDNDSVVGVARLFLIIAPLGYAGYGLVMTINAAFNGMGKPMPGVVVSLMRTILLYVPLALVGQHYYGIAGIFAAYAAANIITGFVAYSWVKRTIHSLCE